MAFKGDQNRKGEELWLHLKLCFPPLRMSAYEYEDTKETARYVREKKLDTSV